MVWIAIENALIGHFGVFKLYISSQNNLSYIRGKVNSVLLFVAHIRDLFETKYPLQSRELAGVRRYNESTNQH